MEIDRLIAETLADRIEFKRDGRGIEAAACDIRLAALGQAQAIMAGEATPAPGAVLRKLLRGL